MQKILFAILITMLVPSAQAQLFGVPSDLDGEHQSLFLLDFGFVQRKDGKNVNASSAPLKKNGLHFMFEIQPRVALALHSIDSRRFDGEPLPKRILKNAILRIGGTYTRSTLGSINPLGENAVIDRCYSKGADGTLSSKGNCFPCESEYSSGTCAIENESDLLESEEVSGAFTLGVGLPVMIGRHFTVIAGVDYDIVSRLKGSRINKVSNTNNTLSAVTEVQVGAPGVFHVAAGRKFTLAGREYQAWYVTTKVDVLGVLARINY